MADYEVFVQDNNRDRVAQVDAYMLLDLVLKFNQPGTWHVEMQAGTTAANLLTWGGGLIVYRDGTEVFSGPVRRIRREWNADQDVLYASGDDELVVLKNRIALPVPSGPPYGASEFDTKTDKAETVVKYYVDYNAGPNARVDRRVSGLTIEADSARGDTVNGRARFEPLLPLIRDLALRGGDLGFKITSGLDFQVYEPSDLTNTVIFSNDLGTLKNFQYEVRAGDTNYVYVLGSGTGVDRTVVERYDIASITRHGLKENILDSRSSGVEAELQQIGDEELDRNAESITLSFEPIEIPGMEFLTDFDLGDQVTAVIDGEDVPGVIREIHIVLDERGEAITSTIGTAGIELETVLKMFANIQAVSERVINLERV